MSDTSFRGFSVVEDLDPRNESRAIENDEDSSVSVGQHRGQPHVVGLPGVILPIDKLIRRPRIILN